MPLKKEVPALSTGVAMRNEWVAELWSLQARLEQNEGYFNMVCDFDMTEANIHEHNALQIRYRYFLNLIREYDRVHRQPSGENAVLVRP